VGPKWNYLGVLLELSARKIIGFSVGQHKTTKLVMQALSQIKAPLSSIALFHSDRAKVFDNQLFDSCFRYCGSLAHCSIKYVLTIMPLLKQNLRQLKLSLSKMRYSPIPINYANKLRQ